MRGGRPQAPSPEPAQAPSPPPRVRPQNDTAPDAAPPGFAEDSDEATIPKPPSVLEKVIADFSSPAEEGSVSAVTSPRGKPDLDES